MVFDGWEEAYASLLGRLRDVIPRPAENLTFELITHRFTMAANRVILKHYPKTKLEGRNPPEEKVGTVWPEQICLPR
jgi:spore photoproduct lyase